MQLPDYLQRAIRLGTAVFIAASIGFELIDPSIGVHTQYPHQWTQACKWAAITCVVINAPVLGKVAQTGVERIVGTIVGGICGYAVFRIGENHWGPVSDGILLSLAAMLVAASSVIIAHKLSLDNSAKLFALTFCLVTFGSTNADDAFILAITRMTGICMGVLLLEACSVIIFPKMATQEALSSMQSAMSSLTELNRKAWQQGTGRTEATEIDLGTSMHPGGYLPLPGENPDDMKDAEQRMHDKQDQLESDAEQCLMDVYNSLNKCLDYIPQAHSEIYVCMLRKKLCMLPGLPWLKIGRWKLPASDMQNLTTCIRKVARILWTTHLTFQEGFDDNMMAMLQQQYPSRLMPELKERSQGTLEDMHAAFPSSAFVKTHNLHTFMNTVEGLFRIGDYQRRRILQHMKRFNRRPSRPGRRSLSVRVDASEEAPQAVPGNQGAGGEVGGPGPEPERSQSLNIRHTSPFAAGHPGEDAKSSLISPRTIKSTYSVRNQSRKRHAPVQDPSGTPGTASPTSPASFRSARSGGGMERQASAAHSTQSERPPRPESMYRRFTSMSAAHSPPPPPTVDQFMGRRSIHARSPSMAASDSALTAHPVAIPVDVQETQADSLEAVAELAGGKQTSSDLLQGACRPSHDASKEASGQQAVQPGSSSLQPSDVASSPPAGSQRKSLQEMYGKHAPRQLWQLPASRLSVGGQQVAGSNGLQQPIVLLPANARQGPGHGRHQGLAVLPGSFAAQALSHTDKASPQASAPHPEGTTPPPLPTQLRPLEAHKLTASFTGRPSDALQSLPDGLTIHRSESPTAQTPGETWTSPVDAQVPAEASAEVESSDEDEAGHVSIQLPHVTPGDLIMFPETAEGYVSKVRWYSFQFLMEELAEELEEMHEILSTLLSKLPTAGLPGSS